MIAITMTPPCGLGVEPLPNGDKVLLFVDQQSGIMVRVPMNQESFDQMRAAWSGVQLARPGQAPSPNGKAL